MGLPQRPAATGAQDPVLDALQDIAAELRAGRGSHIGTDRFTDDRGMQRWMGWDGFQRALEQSTQTIVQFNAAAQMQTRAMMGAGSWGAGQVQAVETMASAQRVQSGYSLGGVVAGGALSAGMMFTPAAPFAIPAGMLLAGAVSAMGQYRADHMMTQAQGEELLGINQALSARILGVGAAPPMSGGQYFSGMGLPPAQQGALQNVLLGAQLSPYTYGYGESFIQGLHGGTMSPMTPFGDAARTQQMLGGHGALNAMVPGSLGMGPVLPMQAERYRLPIDVVQDKAWKAMEPDVPSLPFAGSIARGRLQERVKEAYDAGEESITVSGVNIPLFGEKMRSSATAADGAYFGSMYGAQGVEALIKAEAGEPAIAAATAAANSLELIGVPLERNAAFANLGRAITNVSMVSASARAEGSDPMRAFAVTAKSYLAASDSAEQKAAHFQALEAQEKDPVKKAKYAARAADALAQSMQFAGATISTNYESLRYGYDISSAEIGYGSAGAERQLMRAQLFGGAVSIGEAGMSAAEIHRSRAMNEFDLLGLNQQQVGDLMSGKTSARDIANKQAPEGMSINEFIQRLTAAAQSLNAFEKAAEMASRTMFAVNTNVAGSGAGIAAAQASIAFSGGVGGAAGVGVAQSAIAGQRGIAAAQEAELRNLAQSIQSRGEDPTKNPEYMAKLSAFNQTHAGIAQAEVGLSQVPLSIGTSEAIKRSQFQVGILSTVPGAFGSWRGGLQTYMGDLESGIKELQGAKAAALEGVEDPGRREVISSQYNDRLRSMQLQQAQAFQQMSYGWESRLISQVINAPGNFSLTAPFASYKAAVGANVMNPAYGAKPEDIPSFMRELHKAEWLGSEHPSQAGRSAISGVSMSSPQMNGAQQLRSALEGLKITVEMVMPDGTRKQAPATISNQSGNSSAEQREMPNQMRRRGQ